MLNREETEKEGRTESDPRLWRMEGIDPSAGLAYAGEDAELYREILADYAEGIETQVQAVEHALAAEDIETFTIEVHSLKSTSRTIGALALSDRAKELEEYGKRREWEQIRAGTPGLLTAYRRLYSIITAYCSEEGKEQEKRPADREAVSGLLAELSDSLEAYDSARAEEVITELQRYDLEESLVLYREGLASAIGRFDYESCKTIVGRWREALK